MADLGQTMALAGAKEAIVADFLEALGQDVLQETVDELLGGEGAGFPVVGGVLPVAESDLSVLKFEEALVGESDAEDIRSQILERCLAGADGLTVDNPLLPPDLGWNLLQQLCLFQGRSKLGSKETGEGFDMDKEGIVGAQPGLPLSRQPAAGDKVMNVGMVSQVAGPGLQDAQETKLTADKAGVVGQLLQGRRRGLKQPVIHLPLVTPGQST